MDPCQSIYFRNGRAIKRLFKIISELPNNPLQGIKGGFLSVFNLSQLTLITEPIGLIPKSNKLQYLSEVNQLISESILRALDHRSNGGVVVNNFGRSFLYGDYLVAFIGFPDKNLNEAFSLIYSLYINFSGTDASVESFRTTAHRIITESCLENPHIDSVLNQFLSWYVRIELGKGKKISILVIDENEEWLEIIEDILLPYKIFEGAFSETLEEAENELSKKLYDIIICCKTLVNPDDGNDWFGQKLCSGQRVITLLGNGSLANNLPSISKKNIVADQNKLIDIICEVIEI